MMFLSFLLLIKQNLSTTKPQKNTKPLLYKDKKTLIEYSQEKIIYLQPNNFDLYREYHKSFRKWLFFIKLQIYTYRNKKKVFNSPKILLIIAEPAKLSYILGNLKTVTLPYFYLKPDKMTEDEKKYLEYLKTNLKESYLNKIELNKEITITTFQSKTVAFLALSEMIPNETAKAKSDFEFYVDMKDFPRKLLIKSKSILQDPEIRKEIKNAPGLQRAVEELSEAPFLSLKQLELQAGLPKPEEALGSSAEISSLQKSLKNLKYQEKIFKTMQDVHRDLASYYRDSNRGFLAFILKKGKNKNKKNEKNYQRLSKGLEEIYAKSKKYVRKGFKEFLKNFRIRKSFDELQNGMNKFTASLKRTLEIESRKRGAKERIGNDDFNIVRGEDEENNLEGKDANEKENSPEESKKDGEEEFSYVNDKKYLERHSEDENFDEMTEDTGLGSGSDTNRSDGSSEKLFGADSGLEDGLLNGESQEVYKDGVFAGEASVEGLEKKHAKVSIHADEINEVSSSNDLIDDGNLDFKLQNEKIQSLKRFITEARNYEKENTHLFLKEDFEKFLKFIANAEIFFNNESSDFILIKEAIILSPQDDTLKEIFYHVC